MSGEVAEALPTVAPAAEAGAVEQTQAPEIETTDEAPAEAKPEKTPEQREIERLRRGIDRRTRQLAEARAHNQLTQRPIADINGPSADDSQPLSLSRADLAKIVKAEAERLAPTLASQRTEEARRQGVIESLAKTWGQEKFDEVASDLDEVFGGLTDASGSAKPAIEAVFEADDPVRLIEWLADPENADEAERISKLSAIRAGREIAKLEIRISQESEKLKPRVSKAATPLEPVRGGGNIQKEPANMTDKEFNAWRRTQIKAR